MANPANRSDMSVAMVTSTLRERWYSHPHAPMKWFDMAHDFIREFITEDRTDFPAECPFTNDDLLNLQGFNQDDIEAWKVLCNMELDGQDDLTNDMALVADENDDEGDE